MGDEIETDEASSGGTEIVYHSFKKYVKNVSRMMSGVIVCQRGSHSVAQVGNRHCVSR